MNTYILILTMIFKTGYGGGGMGGIESIQVSDLESCNYIGKAWVNSVSEVRTVYKKEIFYTCIAK